jgi:dipeptidyl aminopeptidase/acylaminoacyl peptidase
MWPARARPADVYTWSVAGGKSLIARWTNSETGGIPATQFVEPQLVKWKSFDEREITGYLYAPDATKFRGKRPVIINIHGGPEAQFRPGFAGRTNYFINELGCAFIFPNIRGSSGYGKTFVQLDNGMKREDSYKDIAALTEWIATQPGLDVDRVMVTGGSYGGHMTLAVATYYPERIRCALNVVGDFTSGDVSPRTRRATGAICAAWNTATSAIPQMLEFMERTAPLNNASKITKPLFVVQGANDPRVPKSEAIQIVDTLKKQGTPVWFLMANDEGHGFAKKKNADFQFYATIQFVREFLLK